MLSLFPLALCCQDATNLQRCSTLVSTVHLFRQQMNLLLPACVCISKQLYNARIMNSSKCEELQLQSATSYQVNQKNI